MSKFQVLIFFLSLCFGSNVYSQCTDTSIGDLDAKNIAYSPSNIYSCSEVTVTTEWDVTSQWPYDADFHQSSLFVTLPPEFVGTSASSFAVSSSDGVTYWDVASAVLTDNSFQIDLTGSIPSSTNISIMIFDMDVQLTGPFSVFTLAQSVTLVEPDCVPSNDGISIFGIVSDADGPEVIEITENCSSTNIGIDLTIATGVNPTFSWEGPNGFSSASEDINFVVPEGQELDYLGLYSVTITNQNGCSTSASILLDESNCLIPVLPVATDNESLANAAGAVVQEVILEDDGDGVDSDADGTLVPGSIDLDPATSGQQTSLIVSGEGTWSVDGSGNVTFTPLMTFNDDPSDITYTIEDNEGNVSNAATISVDYVPVATDDESLANTTNNSVTVDVLANDVDGDIVDPMTVQIVGTTNAGDDLVVTNEGTWSVNSTSGAITFTPVSGFTANPTDITYIVDDAEGNTSNAANVNIEYAAQPPVATDNESLANTAGVVVQEVILEDDGDGVDNDADGSLVAASIDLDPATSGQQTSLLVSGEGTWSVDGAGNVTFTPLMTFNDDPADITYTIEDNDGNVSNAASISVDYVPVATDDESLANTTNSAVTVDVLTNDLDGDIVDPMTVQIVGTANAGDDLIVTNEGTWSVNSTSGAITFTPVSGFTANPTDITYIVDDAEGNTSNAANVNIEYTPQSPVATDNESLANAPGAVVQEVILENDGDGVDIDPDGTLVPGSIDLDQTTSGQQTSLLVSGEGTWSVDGSGNVTFTPLMTFNDDPADITYTIEDNDGNVSNAASISVDYVPVATDDESLANTTNSAVTVDVLANDLDGDIVDPLTVQIIGTANPGDDLVVTNEGTWSVNSMTGAITFTPVSGFTANPTDITYIVDDAEGNTSNAANVNIEYTPQPPVATDNESLANAAGVVVQEVILDNDGDGVDNDADGTLVPGSIDLDPATSGQQTSLLVSGEGTWSVDGAGNVTFTPLMTFNDDPADITYTISDNDGNVSNAASISVDYVPVATDDESLANTTNSAVTVDVLTNDLDGDIVDPTTVQIIGTTNAGDDLVVTNEGTWSVNSTSGAITFTPVPGFTANPTDITYIVDDAEGNTSNAANVNIEYTPQPPVATDNESLANAAGVVVQEVILEDDGDGVDNDADGTLIAASIDLDPATSGQQTSLVISGEGTWSVDGAGNVTFTPLMTFNDDPADITYTIEDNDGNVSNAASISVDYVPVATDDESLANTTNSAVTVDVLANDLSGDVVDPMTVQIIGTTNAGDDFVVTNEGTWSVNSTSGAITFTPVSGFTANPTDITYTVDDAEGNTSNAANVNIEYTPQPPVATDNESLANAPGVVVQEVILENDGDGVDSDADGNLVAASIDLDPATSGQQTSLVISGEGTWSVDGAGNVTFTPLMTFNDDPADITYTIEDNDGNVSNAASISVDYVPVATDDESLANTTNSAVTVDVLANDLDGDIVDPMTVQIIGTTNAGDDFVVTNEGTWSVNSTSGAITFTPVSGFTANPTDITYTVDDAEGNTSNSANVNIEYTAQAPVATDNESLANAPGVVVQEVILENDGDGVDSDPDGTLVAASIDLDPATSGQQTSLVISGEGTWSVDGAGNVTFTPLMTFNDDPADITYTIGDNDGNVSNAASISVDYVPVATDDESLANTTNSAVTVDVLANDLDGDIVDPMTVQIVGTTNAGDDLVVTNEGTWSVNSTSGAITFTPVSGFTANPTDITYIVDDAESNTSNAANVNIEYTAQAPLATDNESLANAPGVVVQEVILENDGDGVDNDPDGTLVAASIDLDPTTTGQQTTLVVSGEGTWSVDGAGNVTFTPLMTFNDDPADITYTIEDNDGNVSNAASISVDYVPVATDDESLANTTNSAVTVDVLANDVDGDIVDPMTVQIVGTTNAGDDLVVTNEGTWSVNSMSGAITFTPVSGFTANPTDITYIVDDAEGNTSNAANVNIEYTAQAPLATDNESLANAAGVVTQEVILENDGDGVDSDPDGTLVSASIDLDPTTTGQQTTLVVSGEGTWSVDGAGNVTFTPLLTFNDDPADITYTIEDNDGNVSNAASISVDYVPVATDDESLANMINLPVTVDVLANDVDGDIVDPSTVQIVGTTNPGDDLVVTNEGTWSVNGVTGAITFTPESGYIEDPTDITYTVDDAEGNTSIAANVNIEFMPQPPVATDNHSLANEAGIVVQEVILEDDGDGVDSDVDGTLVAGSIDLDQVTSGQQTTLLVSGEGTWSVDGSGNVTFTPLSTFNDDPADISYTIEDNDEYESNAASISVDYVPVASDDESLDNTTSSVVTLNITNNDTDGDIVDPSTVSLDPTSVPSGVGVDTDMDGDIDEVTISGEGVWSVDENGNITFTPESGFTGDPSSIDYTVEDDEGNVSEFATVTFDYNQPPVATDNEDLANVPGSTVVQQVITEDDGDGVDNDSDGFLNPTSVNLDPTSVLGVGVDTDMDGDIDEVTVSGEGVWTVDESGNVTFTPESMSTIDPNPIEYTIEDNDGQESNEASIVVDYVPLASDDSNSDIPAGTVVTLNITNNDTGGDIVDPSTVNLDPTSVPSGVGVDTDMDGDIDEVTVSGEGVWSVDENGIITFTPESGFTGDPSAIDYTVEDDEGNDSNVATVTFDYNQPPVATNNEDLANTPGSVVQQQVITEDDGDGADSDPDGFINPTSVSLDPTSVSGVGVDTDMDGDIDEVTVSGEGVWIVDQSGNVTFTPESMFTLDATPIEYTIKDNDGQTSNEALIVVDYVPVSTDDNSTNNAAGTVVTLNITNNDTDGDIVDASTVSLDPTSVPSGAGADTDMDGDIDEVTVSGEGVWSVDASGNITFTPQSGFTGDPSPIDYTVEDDEGNDSNVSTVSIDYTNSTEANDDFNQTLVDISVSGNVSTNDFDAEGDMQIVTGLFADTDDDGVSDDPILVGVMSAVIYGTDDTGATEQAGTILLNTDGTYTFDPNDSFTGTIQIIYVVTDDNTSPLSASATLTIDVTGDNGGGMYPPIAPDDNATMQVGVSVDINVLANDSDPDGTIDTMSVDLDASSIVGASCTDTDSQGDCIKVTVIGEGVWSVDSISGVVTFDPEVGFILNPTPIVYSVNDNDGLSDSALITVVTEDPLTNEMTAEDDGNSGVSGNDLIGNVLDNDIDPEDPTNATLPDVSATGSIGPIGTDGSYGVITIGDTIALYGEDPNNAGSFIIAGDFSMNADGTYNYESAQEFEGTISVSYEACDNEVDNACSTATLYLTTYRLPDLTPGIVVDVATIDEGEQVNIVYNYSNLGPSATVGSDIEFRIFKVSNFGTITMAPVSPEWTLTDEGNYYSLKSNEIIRVGVGERVSFDAVFQHDGADENAIIELTTDIIFGSGGETKITNNFDNQILQIN